MPNVKKYHKNEFSETSIIYYQMIYNIEFFDIIEVKKFERR